MLKATEISNTDFVRTSEGRHKTAVQHFWEVLRDKGHIYKGSYAGWYSTSDEAFLTDEQVEDYTDERNNTTKPLAQLIPETAHTTTASFQVSTESGNPVEWMEEENYKFRLSHFTEDLKSWIRSGVIQPQRFADVALAMLERSLPDLSVSRETRRVGWGIPVPGDSTQCIYVWLDALVNYLTVVGYPGDVTQWPPNCQVIGKDILKFHAIYWPAFLMAAGLDPPRSLFVHSHWTIDGKKMSKSRGNVVDPMKRLEHVQSSELRHVLLREGVPDSDGNYSDLKLVEWAVNDLTNNLGNLFARSVLSKMNSRRRFPVFDQTVFEKIASVDGKLALEDLRRLPDRVKKCYQEYMIHKSITLIMASLRKANTFFQHQEPWRIRDEEDPRLNTTLAFTFETLRVCSILLQPVTPTICDKVLNVLNVAKNERTFSHASQFRTVECQLDTSINISLADRSGLIGFKRMVLQEAKDNEAKKAAKPSL